MMNLLDIGAEILVESHTRGLQRHPALATSADRFLVAWTDDMQPPCDIGGPDVRAKLFRASGEPLGGEFRVNTETIDHQRDPKAAGLPNGGFVVVWQDFSGRGGDPCCGGIKARLFGPDGRASEEFLVNVETANRQFNATVAARADGTFAIAWQAYGDAGGEGGVRARLFGPGGAARGGEILVSVCSEGRQDSPLVAGLADGRFVVVWSDLSVASGATGGGGINARILGPDGATGPDAFIVAPASRHQHPTGVAGLRDGGFAIAWTDHGGGPEAVSGAPIKMRLFDSAGEPRGKGNSIIAETLEVQQGPVLASLVDGSFVVAWTDAGGRGEKGGKASVKAARFGPQGVPIGGDLLVSAGANVSRSSLAVTGLAEGGFVVAWEDVGGVAVRARVFDVRLGS